MSTQNQIMALAGLGERDRMLVGPMDDLRGLRVVDNEGEGIGRVDDVLIDRTERRVRLLLLRSSGSGAGPEPRTLIPVEAVSRIGDREVSVNRPRAHVLAAPSYLRDRVDQRYLETIYAHYGLYPFWAPGYVYPRYPAYP